jgi:hypothetical protein
MYVFSFEDAGKVGEKLVFTPMLKKLVKKRVFTQGS